MPNCLKLANVSRTFRGFTLSDISFVLEPGYIMGLVGPNGSGKTTTIKLIMNMIHRDSGSIQVNGLDCMCDEAEVKQKIGYVSDENIFVEDWNASDIAKSLSLYYKSFDTRKFYQYLKQFELPKNKKVKEFSRGMKTRLMLSAALSRETELLLLDEPTSGLDPVVRRELLDILQEYISDGKHSVLFSTHITTDLEKVADFITFIFHGKMVFSKNKDNILNDYRIIKGSPEKLTSQLKKKCVGLREGKLGFEGLIESHDLTSFPSGIILEHPSLDEIIVYYTVGERS